MLPNWLYGKSKSKLQEILGGGGGGTTYTAGDGIDISNGLISFDPATSPAIDPSKIDGLDDDLAALAPKTALSNPNILHNPWFTVNQRAVTTLTTSGNYIADRWQIITGETNFSVSISNNKITINNSSGEGSIYIRQKRTSTYISSLQGMKLTASVMLDDGTIFSGTNEVAENATTLFYNDDNISIDLRSSSDVNALLVLQVKPGASVTIKALKLEVGSVSTLAMDTAPDMALELAKCQRYFQRYARKSGQSAAYLGMFYRDSSTANIVIDLPVNMRTTPIITLTSALNLEVADGSKQISAIGSVTPNETCNKLRLTSLTMDSQPAGTIGIVTLTGSNYLDFSAEL